MKLNEIDFDNKKQVQKHAEEKVELKVGELRMLLEYFYAGGGEPERLNARLRIVQQKYKDYI